jgi:hypothetical protein
MPIKPRGRRLLLRSTQECHLGAIGCRVCSCLPRRVTPTLLDDKEAPDGTIGRQQRHDG